MLDILYIYLFNPFLFANERTEMKLKIYLSEAWMCSEFGMLITDVERERVKAFEKMFKKSLAKLQFNQR